MGVNKKTRQELRQMLKNHGGFGYFDLNIYNLGARSLLISQHWDLPSPPGIALRYSFEKF